MWTWSPCTVSRGLQMLIKVYFEYLTLFYAFLAFFLNYSILARKHNIDPEGISFIFAKVVSNFQSMLCTESHRNNNFCRLWSILKIVFFSPVITYPILAIYRLVKGCLYLKNSSSSRLWPSLSWILRRFLSDYPSYCSFSASSRAEFFQKKIRGICNIASTVLFSIVMARKRQKRRSGCLGKI